MTLNDNLGKTKMIIDIHTHIGYGDGLEATPQQLIKSMDQAKIDKALVFASNLHKCPTKTLLEAIAPYPGKLYGVASISGEHLIQQQNLLVSQRVTKEDRLLVSQRAVQEELDYLEELLHKEAIHGLKIYSGYEHLYPQDEVYIPFFELFSKYRRPVIFHTGDTFSVMKRAKLKYAQPLHLDDIATDFPDLPIIIAHLGYPWQVDAAEVAYKNKNVYLDCSGLTYGWMTSEAGEQFCKVVKEAQEILGNSDKILFGTDWPICHQEGYIDNIEYQTVRGKLYLPYNSDCVIKLFGIK